MFKISDDINAQAANQNEDLQHLWKVFYKIREKGLKLKIKIVYLLKLLWFTWGLI